MNIVRRENRYFLQLTNGEMELSEAEVQKRIKRGDELIISENLPISSPEQERDEPDVPPENTPFSVQTPVQGGKYFNAILKEFEEIYLASEDKKAALEKLIRFCEDTIDKLSIDRKNPKTDHVVIDHFILSWEHVISALRSLPGKIGSYARNIPDDQTASSVLKNKLLKQCMIVQLLQADGLFPISDALQGVTQNDIIGLIAGILQRDSHDVQTAIQRSSSILLRRAHGSNQIHESIAVLEELDTFFEKLPYSNIISRIKLLLKIYREKGQQQSA